MIMNYHCKCGNGRWILRISKIENTYEEKIIPVNMDYIGGSAILICSKCGNRRIIRPETPVDLNIYKKMDDK